MPLGSDSGEVICLWFIYHCFFQDSNLDPFWVFLFRSAPFRQLLPHPPSRLLFLHLKLLILGLSHFSELVMNILTVVSSFSIMDISILIWLRRSCQHLLWALQWNSIILKLFKHFLHLTIFNMFPFGIFNIVLKLWAWSVYMCCFIYQVTFLSFFTIVFCFYQSECLEFWKMKDALLNFHCGIPSASLDTCWGLEYKFPGERCQGKVLISRLVRKLSIQRESIPLINCSLR